MARPDYQTVAPALDERIGEPRRVRARLGGRRMEPRAAHEYAPAGTYDIRLMESIALEVWEEEVTDLKQRVREGTIDLAEAQRRRAVLDEVCALFAEGKPEEAIFGNGRLNTRISDYFNRRFALKMNADRMAGLPPQSRREVQPYKRAWPERWWARPG